MADCQTSYSGRPEKRADMEAVQVLLVNPTVELVLVTLKIYLSSSKNGKQLNHKISEKIFLSVSVALE